MAAPVNRLPLAMSLEEQALSHGTGWAASHRTRDLLMPKPASQNLRFVQQKIWRHFSSAFAPFFALG
jgi:hypothetical protein